MEQNFEVMKTCFEIIDGYAEEHWEVFILGRLIVRGANITQAENQTPEMKNYRTYIRRCLKYNGREPWEAEKYNYLHESYDFAVESKYAEGQDFEEEYNINLHQFFQDYLQPVICINRKKIVAGFPERIITFEGELED